MQNHLKLLFSLCLVMFLVERHSVFGQSFDKKSLNKEVCGNLPRVCRYIDSRRIYYIFYGVFYKKEWLVCENGLDAAELRRMERFSAQCRNKKPTINASISHVSILYSISMRATSGWRILNDSFGVFKLNKNDQTDIYRFSFTLRLSNLKGFDIDSPIDSNLLEANLELQTDFNLYQNDKFVKYCQNFSTQKFIFKSRIYSLSILRPKPIYPVCYLFFRNANINGFKLSTMSNSFYMKNTVSFTDPNGPSGMNLNSSIDNLNLEQVYMIDIDSKLLNRNIFATIRVLAVQGHLNSIETNVFAPFRNLRDLMFKSTSMMELIRRQGIGWIKAINADVRVDLTNQTDFTFHRQFYTGIVFTSDRFERFNLNDAEHDDADFCLFIDFPSHQMVFFREDATNFERAILYQTFHFTCTQLWLFRFKQLINSLSTFYIPNRFDQALFSANFTACEFERRIQLCNRSQYHFHVSKSGTYTWFDFMVGLEFSFVIILPVLLGSFGIVTNILVIRVIFHKKNKKTMRSKQYIYMSLHCLSNVLICFIQFVNLLNECQYPYGGLFCSSIRHLVGVQYLRIIFGEYLNSVLRLVSNFAYFGFSICRLAKIGTNQSKFTVFVSEKLSIKVYMGVVVFGSAGLSVCKCLQFNINYDYPDLAYPLPFIQNPHHIYWLLNPKLVAIFVINTVFNFINYFLFVFVHLTVDIILIRKLRQVMREKEEKMHEMKKSEKEMEKMSKENEESSRRAVIMVICNSTFNFLLKLPLLIPALNDFRLLFYFSNHLDDQNKLILNLLNLFSSPFNFKFLCLTEKSCQVFQSFGNCFFLVSLSIILFFLKQFDMNFKSSFKNVISVRNTKNKI